MLLWWGILGFQHICASGCGVTANIHDSGSCDSGFESQQPDNRTRGGVVGLSEQPALLASGIRKAFAYL